MVTRGRRRPAVDHVHRQPLRLARGLRQYRIDGLFQRSAAGLAASTGIDRLTGRSQDMGRPGAKPDDCFAAIDHDVADVGAVCGVHLHGTAADQTDGRQSGCDWAGICAVRYLRLRRNCGRHPNRRFLGRLQDFAAVYGDNAHGHHRLGAQRGHLPIDGLLGRDLGFGFCVDQLDAAGQAGWRGARPRVRIGLAQHLGAIYRAGRGLGHWWRALRARPALWGRLRSDGFCRGGTDNSCDDEAEAGSVTLLY